MTSPSLPPADAQIDASAALQYWADISPDVNGMLGGFPQISRIDLQGSTNFLAKLRRLDPVAQSRKTDPCRAADCGAGIGRVTKGFLVKRCDIVDIVEPIKKFVAEIRDGESFEDLRAKGKIGELFTVGLEDWRPALGRYDLIWNQWCVGHLKDAALVEYLKRCGAALTEGGWVVVKENLSTSGQDVFDELDSSVTRTDGSFQRLFEVAGMSVVKTELQMGFPRGLGLYPVRFYALRPKRIR